MKQTFLLSILACQFVFAQCKKEKNTPPADNPYGLPNATQIGANVFACRVNGQNWISKTGIYNMGGVSNDTLFFHGSNPVTTTYYEQFDIAIISILQGNNSYSLDDTSRRFAKFSTNKPCFSNIGGLNVGSGKSYEGELFLVKIDTVRKILSGTFQFKIKTDFCDTLKITDGRFDIRYF